MFLADCSKYQFIINIAVYIFKIVQWIIPGILIFFVTVDIVKAIIGGDEKSSKDVNNRILKRLIYAVIIFLIPLMVRFIFRAVDRIAPSGYGTGNSSTSWVSCFNTAFNK